MEAHVGLEHGAIALAQARGALAPVRRIVEADRIADAGSLLVAGAPDDAPPSRFDLFAGDARAGRIQRRLQPFLHSGAEAAEAIRRAAEIEGAGKRRVVAVMATAEFEITDCVRLIAVARPGEVRGGALCAGRGRGQSGGIIAPEAGGAADLRRHDGRDRIAFAHARGRRVHADLHRVGNDRRRAAPHGDLCRRLHDPRPGDEPAGVGETGVGKVAGELRVGSGGIVPAIELDPDASASPPRFAISAARKAAGWRSSEST